MQYTSRNNTYFIQIGVFTKRKNAQYVAKKAEIYGNVFFSEIMLNNKKASKVLLGPFNSWKKIKKVQMKQSFIHDFGKNTIIKKF